MLSSEELQQLMESAHGLLKEHAGARAFRKMREQDPDEGFDITLWQRMAELGWTGIAVPEAFGGYDMGPTAAIAVADALGAHIASVPFAGTVLASKALAAGAGGSSEMAAHLGALAEGRALFAIAIDEGPRHTGLERIGMTAQADGSDFVLSGMKRNVLDVPAAQNLLVAAKTDGGLTAFVVPKDAAGVSVSTSVRLDIRRSSKIQFDGVRVPATAVMGSVGGGEAVLTAALDTARTVVAAEMVGAAKGVFDMTIAYMRDRKQFGVPIGSFQALQHRAAHVHTELQIAEAAVKYAARQLAEAPEKAAEAAAVAKSKAGRVAIHAANEAVQLHGGVGVTDEFDVGLYVKRIRTLENQFGDHLYHTDKFAGMRGY